MRREPRRWRTSFGRFVRSVGVERLTIQLRSAGQPITRNAVYNWLAGDHAPRPEAAAAIVRLSRGRLQLAEIYRHREKLAAGARSIEETRPIRD